jgi:hypothetical protein
MEARLVHLWREAGGYVCGTHCGLYDTRGYATTASPGESTCPACLSMWGRPAVAQAEEALALQEQP